MTDNEIIKALECLCGDEIPCKDCAYKSDAFACRRMTAIDALDLINRQQAEIEGLKIENQSLRSAAVSYSIHYNKARAEAIKEFAERLKETKFKHDNDYIIYAKNIDVLVKEMAGNAE